MRVSLIGLGRISNRHINAVLNHKNLELVSICDKDLHKSRHQALDESIPFYLDYIQMIEETQPELVAVLTDSGSHFDIGMQLSKMGVHVIIEKPLALTVLEADALLKAFELTSQKLFVVKQNRFNIPMQKLKNAISAGQLGKPFLCNTIVHWCRTQEYYDQDDWRGKWLSDGGVISNQAIHHLDAMLWLMGDIESVSSFNSTYGSDIEVDDTNVAIVKFKNGALGTVQATTAARPKNQEGSITILGSQGSVKIGGHAMNKIEYWNTSLSNNDIEIDADLQSDTSDVYGAGHDKFYEHVYAVLDGDAKSELFGDAGKKSLELVCALYLSAELQRIVKVGEDTSQIVLGNLK